MDEYRNYIGGEWKAPRSGEYYPDHNPADGSELIGRFPLSTADDAAEAVRKAHEAFPAWAALLPAERAGYLEKFVELLARAAPRIGEALCREEGKTLKEAHGEPLRGVAESEFFLGEALRLEGLSLPSDRRGVTSLARRVPIGVVAAIAPWNFPFLTPIRKIIPALAMGNTVVFKPAYDTPHCGVLLMELLEEAGLPAGVANLVIGRGSVMGDALSSDPLVKGITFTGSTAVGRRINRLAAEHFAKVQLEMGGKNPCIVADYGDLERAAAEIASAAYAVSGQRCTSISRLIVLRKHAEDLEALIARRAEAYVLGPGLDPRVTMGPLINREAGEGVMAYIEGALAEGARLATGGHRLSGGDFDKGFYLEPSLLTGVRPEMRVAREEIFGPVLVSLRVDSFEEALALANDSPYGLAASLFSENLGYIEAFQRRMEAGMTHVNHGTVTDLSMPFGGVKDSGLGPFSKGSTNRDFYTNYQVNYLKLT